MTPPSEATRFEIARAELSARTPASAKASDRAAHSLAMEVVQTVVMPHPIYIQSAEGGRLTDLDGNIYIDLTGGFGPNVLGNRPESVQKAIAEQIEKGWHWGIHNPLQADLAELICEASACADSVAFANSGTEATMYATRLARAHTGKDKVALFDGSYHGVHDYALTKANSQSPRSEPTAGTLGNGVPQLIPQETMLMLPYRDPHAFELIRRHRDDLALVMIEPVQSSNPRLDAGDFLGELIEVCRENNVLVLFDEVITGFRIEYGGCQEYYGLTPDLATYGKAIGGGLPIGAVAGRAEIMNGFTGKNDAPFIFCGGTFSGNPLAMAAGTAALASLRDQKDTLYPYLHQQGSRFAELVNSHCATEQISAQVMNAGSLLHLMFQAGPIEGQRDISGQHRGAEAQFYLHLINQGVIIPGIHLAFFSAAHTPADVDQVFEGFKRSFDELRQDGAI